MNHASCGFNFLCFALPNVGLTAVLFVSRALSMLIAFTKCGFSLLLPSQVQYYTLCLTNYMVCFLFPERGVEILTAFAQLNVRLTF